MQRLVGGWIVGVSRNEGLMEGPVIVSLIVASVIVNSAEMLNCFSVRPKFWIVINL